MLSVTLLYVLYQKYKSVLAVHPFLPISCACACPWNGKVHCLLIIQALGTDLLYRQNTSDEKCANVWSVPLTSLPPHKKLFIKPSLPLPNSFL